jgi:hypothetical protein
LRAISQYQKRALVAMLAVVTKTLWQLLPDRYWLLHFLERSFADEAIMADAMVASSRCRRTELWSST